jgi:hypothetical protein
LTGRPFEATCDCGRVFARAGCPALFQAYLPTITAATINNTTITARADPARLGGPANSRFRQQQEPDLPAVAAVPYWILRTSFESRAPQRHCHPVENWIQGSRPATTRSIRFTTAEYICRHKISGPFEPGCCFQPLRCLALSPREKPTNSSNRAIFGQFCRNTSRKSMITIRASLGNPVTLISVIVFESLYRPCHDCCRL